MHKIFFLIFLQITVIQIFGQSTPSFHAPLKIPLYLSGNFGEIRSDHFHSGIDIKTKGSTGHHVSAIESGYISRIKVQANGYGKSVYLAHPGGYTSVYGHLDRYREDIEAYVIEQQYRRKSHQLDLYPEPAQFPIEKGDFIAYSGNSGGSLGAHLHFEIRNSGNQHPTNVLQYGFDIADHIAPRFKQLIVYPLDEHALVNGSHEKQYFDLVIDQGVYTIAWGTKLEVSGAIGIGVEVYDYLDGAPNRCGIYTLEGFLDDGLFYKLEMDEFSFSETRYVNAHIDYGEKMTSGRKVRRLFRLPNDRLRIYSQLKNNGRLELTEPGIRTIKVLASDVAGNSAQLAVKLKVNEYREAQIEKQQQTFTLMKYDAHSLFQNEHVTVELPPNALFEDLKFTYSETPPSNGFLSVNYEIHSTLTPLLKPYTLAVQAPAVSPELREKLIFVTYDPEEDRVISAGGKYQDGKVVASLRSFGTYAVSVDTLAPEITPLNGSGQRDLSGKKSLRFSIQDDLSGIEKYEGYLDKRWVLFEYDPKNDLLFHTFDSTRITQNQEHELELYVSDAQGNVKLYHAIFTW